MSDTKKEWLIAIGKIAATILLVYMAIHFLIGIHIYHGNYMAPWMRDGDLVITSRIEERMVNRVAAYKYADGSTRFGRIIAVPGDVVNIDAEGHYFINNNVPLEQVYYDTAVTDECIAFPYTVPDDTLFILNDMREDMNDSRMAGAIPTSDIEGIVYFTMSRRGF